MSQCALEMGMPIRTQNLSDRMTWVCWLWFIEQVCVCAESKEVQVNMIVCEDMCMRESRTEQECTCEGMCMRESMCVSAQG